MASLMLKFSSLMVTTVTCHGRTLFVCGTNKQGAAMLQRLGVAAKLPPAMADPTVHRRVCLQYAVQQLGTPETLSTSNPDAQSNPQPGQPELALP